MPDKEDIPLYNSRIIDTYIKLIKRKYSHVKITELLSYAKMKAYEVADEGHWFTQEQINLFYEKLVQLTGNKNIAREAGRYAASPEAIGVMRQYIMGMMSPANVYETIGKATSNFTKSSIYKSRKITSNKVEITVTLNEGVIERSYQCENRMGFFDAASMIFTNTPPRIDHPECMFKGGNICRYIISWENPFSFLWKKITNYTALFLFLTCLISIFISPFVILKIFLPVSITIVLGLTLIGVSMENKELKAGLDNLRGSSDELLQQIEINYNNALVINEVGEVISRQTTIEDILTNVIQVSRNRLDYDRGMILLTNPEKNRLVFRGGYGYTDEQQNLLKKTVFHLDRPESKGAFVVSFREQKPILINNIENIENELSLRSLVFAKKLGTQAFICCPIISDKESIGIFAVDNLNSKKPLVQSDLSLLMGIAPSIGISIRNAQLLEARERQFRSILEVLAASIDARDPLTAGHSQKVTEYTLGICNELGLPEDETEMIRVAALLHDYGKIGVPDAILKKPGKLTEEEYEIVKKHAEKTREILEQINFEGIFSQVPEIAGAHHEKIDGSGYPKGLKGKDIPLGARIIAVADVFEAITAKRHYRNPMPLEKAFDILWEESGVHLDKSVVEAFYSYYTKLHTDKLPLEMVSSM
ncbi:MAG: HD domain-containing protein [Deltaproteobacteria bacterium]|nr:HD domain-containing protein [Deltaproteobacteria bacterium]